MNDKRHGRALRRIAACGLALLPIFSSGCLYLGASERIDFDEAKRLPVKCASAQAARDFHAAIRLSDKDEYTDKGGWVMALLLARGHSLYHETAHYNAAVRRADVNRDGTITEEEAQSFLAEVTRESDA